MERLESAHSCTANWFTPDTAFAVYSQFIQLDENRDGLVDWKELTKYGRMSQIMPNR